MDPGSKIVLECVTYVCDGEAKSLVPIGKGNELILYQIVVIGKCNTH